MDVDAVADELYALDPAEFTATRNARAKQAREAGNRDLAEKIRGLAKPTTVAWLANRLVRDHRDEVAPLLELGAGLREATATLAGEELRRLSHQQHQLVYALVGQARSLANAAGHRMSEDTARGLEDTLRAALADPALADELSAGRLTDALHHSGLTPGGGTSGRPSQRSAPATPAADDGLDGAERDVAEAREAAEAAARTRDEAATAVADAEGRTAEQADVVRRLREQVADAETAQHRAERDERQARTTLDRADRAARDAQRRVDDAVKRRDRLEQQR